MRQPTADLERRLENILRFGVVDSVDHAAARCVVKSGDLVTTPLPWLTARAGAARTWWAPSIGEQVLLLSPGGDPARAVVAPGLYSTSAPRPDGMADTSHGVQYDDGAVVVYDPSTHQLTATLPEGGTAHITAPGGARITGDTVIDGTLSVTGDTDLQAKLHVADDVTADAKVTASSDVVGGGISLKSHKHSGVQSGGSLTGGPQ